MSLIYLASPYSLGDQALNVRRQIEVADKLLEMGHIPFIPCLSHLWHLISPKSYDEWLRIGIEYLTYCDALLRLTGESAGADKEVLYAITHNIQVYFDIKDIPNIKLTKN